MCIRDSDKKVKVDLDSVEINVPVSDYGGGAYETPPTDAQESPARPGAAATDAILEMIRQSKEQ